MIFQSLLWSTRTQRARLHRRFTSFPQRKCQDDKQIQPRFHRENERKKKTTTTTTTTRVVAGLAVEETLVSPAAVLSSITVSDWQHHGWMAETMMMMMVFPCPAKIPKSEDVVGETIKRLTMVSMERKKTTKEERRETSRSCQWHRTSFDGLSVIGKSNK